MTFILNVLHKDMSIIAADQKALAEWPSISGFPSRGKAVVHDYKKITRNSTGILAIGMSGYSAHHSYIGGIEGSESINYGLSIIRKHMESFLRVDDRALLIKSASPFRNECVASFYDEGAQTYFTNVFQFNEFTNTTYLHRASDGVKVFCAGSCCSHFELKTGKIEIESLIAENENSDLPEICITWMKDVFRKVSMRDEDCGSEPLIALSTRANHEFRFI